MELKHKNHILILLDDSRIDNYYEKLGFIKKMFLFLVTVGIYVGVDKFKKFFYLFLSGSQ